MQLNTSKESTLDKNTALAPLEEQAINVELEIGNIITDSDIDRYGLEWSSEHDSYEVSHSLINNESTQVIDREEVAEQKSNIDTPEEKPFNENDYFFGYAEREEFEEMIEKESGWDSTRYIRTRNSRNQADRETQEYKDYLEIRNRIIKEHVRKRKINISFDTIKSTIALVKEDLTGVYRENQPKDTTELTESMHEMIEKVRSADKEEYFALRIRSYIVLNDIDIDSIDVNWLLNPETLEKIQNTSHKLNYMLLYQQKLEQANKGSLEGQYVA